ncbi:hypothetical protein [Mesorhizobium sp. CAU 1732]|uniref:hypothetical protein n=1 Tax=Mesorhizobium sp. CAU 1732 TaxID=3140358 RepID=UPI003261B290
MIGAISTGCASIDAARLAGASQGVSDAGLTIGVLPDDCRTIEPHAALVDGAEIRSVLKRERAALDRANARVTRCADYHDDLVEHLDRT